MQRGWSNIKEPGDSIKKTQNGLIPENAILFTADAVGLYPSIPHEAGLKALREILDKGQQYTIPTRELIRMADFVLKNNYLTDKLSNKFLVPPLVPSLAHPTSDCLRTKLKLLFLKPKSYNLLCGLDILTILFLSG